MRYLVLLVCLLGACNSKLKPLNLEKPVYSDLGRQELIEVGNIRVKRPDITNRNLGIIYNVNDPESENIARYYQKVRDVPEENLFAVSLPVKKRLTRSEFDISLAGSEHIKAWALAWTMPFKVAGMSVTSALTFGVDEKYYATSGCKRTAISPLYNQDFGALKPSMLLTAGSPEDTKAMIARGLEAEGSLPDGKAYLVITGDKNRDIRAEDFRNSPGATVVSREGLANVSDVIFHLTGTYRVQNIDSISYLPGALADHLTSYGGVLVEPEQMPVTEFLKRGVSASYGTVTEPCAMESKFPRASILLRRYFLGDTAIEAYWRSVERPGEGLFVGDPLARAFGWKSEAGVIRTTSMLPGEKYLVFDEAGNASHYFEVSSVGLYELDVPPGSTILKAE